MSGDGLFRDASRCIEYVYHKVHSGRYPIQLNKVHGHDGNALPKVGAYVAMGRRWVESESLTVRLNMAQPTC